MFDVIEHQIHSQFVLGNDFDPFLANDHFLYLLQTSENQRFSNVFRGYRERMVRWTSEMFSMIFNNCFRKVESIEINGNITTQWFDCTVEKPPFVAAVGNS